MKEDLQFNEMVQELLDEGNSMNKVASTLGIHHSKINRMFNRKVIEIYTAFDEEEDEAHLSQNFEWLWEEDKLEECCNKAFDNYSVNLNQEFENNFFDVGAYVKKEYGNFYNYLIKKNKIMLWEFFYKECTKCKGLKPLSSYSKKKNHSFGINGQCTTCVIEYVVYNYRNNEAYRQKVKECNVRWRIENKEKIQEMSKRGAHKRFARMRSLPDDLTKKQLEMTLIDFDGMCVLTGDAKIHLDHVIPLSIGHGGTTYGNMIPLRADLNMSKNDSNIFEWFESNRQRFELSQERFDKLIEWLASANAMTIEEYRAYVYECHDNPRNIDEIKTEGGSAS